MDNLYMEMPLVSRGKMVCMFIDVYHCDHHLPVVCRGKQYKPLSLIEQPMGNGHLYELKPRPIPRCSMPLGLGTWNILDHPDSQMDKSGAKKNH